MNENDTTSGSGIVSNKNFFCTSMKNKKNVLVKIDDKQLRPSKNIFDEM